MTSQTKVAVIGGGIGGLAAALALLKRGIDVEVYEQSAELREVGAGIQISSNGTRVLYALGLEDALKRVQVLPSRREIRHWSSGETWNWFDLGATTAQRYGTPHVMLHRGDLHGLLADAVQSLKPDAVRLGKRCVAVSQTGDRSRSDVRERRDRHGRLRDRRRRHPFQGARLPVRRRPAGLHRLRRVARASCRWRSCPRTSRRCSAPTGSARTAMCCTIRCAAAN